MSRKILALLLLASALWLGCGGSDSEGSGAPFFTELAVGAYFPDRLVLDTRDLYLEKKDAANDLSWTLPMPRGVELGSGWSFLEEWGTWSVGERSQIRFHLRRLGPRDLYVDGVAPPDPGGREQGVRVVANGVEVGSFRIGPEGAARRVSLPVEALRQGGNEIELVYDFHLDPGGPKDRRPLAFGIRRLAILPPGEDPDTQSGPALRVYRDQEVMVFDQPGSYVVPLRLPAGTKSLELEVRADDRGSSAGKTASFRASLIGHEGQEKQLLALDAIDREAVRLDLTSHAEREVFLALDTEPAAGNRLTIRDVRLVSEARAQGSANKVAAGSAAGARPHIVFVVLDAARADHFGVYGYARDTTPNIDRIAKDSLVFRNAISECSYTVCSMPSLLTGLSFIQHGLISKSLALQPNVQTLAETLHEAGYLTLGYTGNPNNSSITGTNQGFDELYEIWDTHPGRITRQAIARLEQGTDGRPLFLMLHYVPPHEPYAPDPEFDVFGDPRYRGKVSSDRELTRAIYQGDVELDAADLAELVSLYDGNLKMGDDAVGQVMAALERAGIFDQALVVITADHGEAFLEHGYVGHNTTIYDEMLHVPLIVKLPAGIAAPDGLDLGKLVTLADVVPMVHRFLGLALPSAVESIDLLEPREDHAERAIFLRSGSSENPIYGVRTSSFKAIVRTGSSPQLYDLSADPVEKVNVVGERPLLHAGLILLLEQALGEPAPLRAGLGDSEISEESREQLRALGYL